MPRIEIKPNNHPPSYKEDENRKCEASCCLRKAENINSLSMDTDTEIPETPEYVLRGDGFMGPGFRALLLISPVFYICLVMGIASMAIDSGGES